MNLIRTWVLHYTNKIKRRSAGGLMDKCKKKCKDTI